MTVFVPAVAVGQANAAKRPEPDGNVEMKEKPGLYANIRAKRERIAEGSGERMRKPGTKGAPTAKAFKASAKTAKRPAKAKGKQK
jgi:hypothetical protein